MCHQQKWHHRKSPLLFLVLSSIPKQTKTFPTAKRHKSTLNEKIPKGDFRGPRLTSNGRSRFVWNLYARTTLCKWIHKHWICKHALGLKIATKMSHYGWASEASETILYSGRNHLPPKYFIKRYYIDNRVQKVAKSVEIRKVAKFVEIYYIRVKK